MTTLDTVYVQSDGLTVREVGEEMIFLSGNGDMLHTVNEVGAFIWKCIDGSRSAADVLKLICDAYEVTPEKAEEDLAAFLKELREKKLVSTV